MASSAKELFDEAMKLPPEERARLGADLLGSLHDEPAGEVEAAWRKEILRRIEEIDRGEVALESWGAVYERLRAKLDRK